MAERTGHRWVTASREVDPADEIRALAHEATDGPWYVSWGSGSVFGVRTKDETVVPSGRTVSKVVSRRADAAYIAAVSPDVVLALLDERDRLRAAARRVDEAWTVTSNAYDITSYVALTSLTEMYERLRDLRAALDGREPTR